MLIDLRLPVFLGHGSAKAMLHFLGFASEHCGLVSHADCLQMNVRIEALGIGPFKLFQKLGFVTAVHDVIADVIRLRQRKYNKIMSTTARASLRTGGLGFFMPRFAMNDA